MKGFNLSEWAINHRSFVWFLMILFVAAGVLSYKQLGREEDPSFSIKTMIVRTYWPGATIDDTMLQVTDRIEKKLQETPSLYYLKSETKPGVSTIYVNVLDSTPKEAIPDIWYQVRKKVADIKRDTAARHCRARASTTSSATSSALFTRSRPTGSRTASCATMSNEFAHRY